MPPLLLDDDEAVAVSIGLRTAACTSIAGIEETSLRALAKLEQTLPTRLRRRIGALQTAVEPLDWGTPYAIVEPEALALLSQACRDREQVRFDYEDKEGTPSRRLVEPFRLVPAGRRWYLVAWDVRRDDWRTFRLDRASRPRLAGVRGPVRELPAPDAATYVQQSISYRDTGPEVTVVLHAAAEDLEGRLAAHLGAPEPIDEASCRLRTSADSIEWLALRLALSGVEFTVESPPEMRSVLRELGERITRAASDAP
jgi:predicted DNA-binding transcriptional regulator YafY